MLALPSCPVTAAAHGHGYGMASMSPVSDHYDPLTLGPRLAVATAVTPELMSDVIDKACRHFSSPEQNEKTKRLKRLIDAEAWADAALALIELELPPWQVRRIDYDEGEWHCALSRQRELPDWLDQSIEARHPDLAVALLDVLVETQAATAPAIWSSVPAAPSTSDPLDEPLCCDNFG